jgi:hypothetical protein
MKIKPEFFKNCIFIMSFIVTLFLPTSSGAVEPNIEVWQMPCPNRGLGGVDPGQTTGKGAQSCTPNNCAAWCAKRPKKFQCKWGDFTDGFKLACCDCSADAITPRETAIKRCKSNADCGKNEECRAVVQTKNTKLPNAARQSSNAHDVVARCFPVRTVITTGACKTASDCKGIDEKCIQDKCMKY